MTATEYETNQTDTRPWVKPEAPPPSQVDRMLRRLLNEPDGRAFLFDLLRSTNAFDQASTRPDFGARLLDQLMGIDSLGVGAMWAEGMAAKHAKDIEKKQ